MYRERRGAPMISETSQRPSEANPLLGNIGKALHQVSLIVARLEEASLNYPMDRADVTQKTRALQDFDLILQSLTDLAQLMEALGRYGLPHTVSEKDRLIADMRLAWLKDVIEGSSGPSERETAKISFF
jgi:hypothetical protein